MYHADTYVSLSISVPKSLRKEIHERALSLRMTRTDYVKALIMADLSQGPDAQFALTLSPRSREAVSQIITEEKRRNHSKRAAPVKRERGGGASNVPTRGHEPALV